MVLSGDQLAALQEGVLEQGSLDGVQASEPSGNAVIGSNFLWPGNTVSYELAYWLSSTEKVLVRNTLERLQAKLGSCVRF